MQNYHMQYNSSKERLVLPEYGRNVQLLINHAKTIEDPDIRQAFVEKVLRLMHQMNPQNRGMEEYKDKLWGHVFHIAGFDLDVIPDVGDIPTQESAVKKPETIPYPHYDTKFRHYGYNVQKLTQKAQSMEEGPKRDGFISTIASYMKLAYKTWNRDHYVSDEVIKRDLQILSDGELKVKDGVYLDSLSSNYQSSPNKHSKSKRPHNKKSNSYQKNNSKNSRGSKPYNKRRK